MNGLANAPCEQGILVGQVEQLSIHVYTSNQQTKYQIRQALEYLQIQVAIKPRLMFRCCTITPAPAVLTSSSAMLIARSDILQFLDV